jgi:hypothetical protein
MVNIEIMQMKSVNGDETVLSNFKLLVVLLV